MIVNVRKYETWLQIISKFVNRIKMVSQSEFLQRNILPQIHYCGNYVGHILLKMCLIFPFNLVWSMWQFTVLSSDLGVHCE